MISLFRVKKHLSYFLDLICLNRLMFFAQVKLFFPFIRVINYHDIPPSYSGEFEEQLLYFAKYFSPVGYEDLIHFHDGEWKSDKPGLIISFDDGYRSGYEVAAPLLEKYGFTGWFFIPTALIDLPLYSQLEESAKHRVFPKSYDQEDPRLFLTWEQIVELDRTHIIGCHTASHCRLKSTLTKENLLYEIVISKQILEERLQHNVSSFAWVGGEEFSYSKQAAEVLRQANYQLIFLTNNLLVERNTDLRLLNRTNIEADFPLSLVRFQLSGFMDLLYTPKRKRVERLIGRNGEVTS